MTVKSWEQVPEFAGEAEEAAQREAQREEGQGARGADRYDTNHDQIVLLGARA